ncbi:hypothetical protein V1514DRAFT_304182 [Lipomyces japonicus]|uniref:uncharacterized protein n=1 Tax=Lipomyces japonicus TaxID=56871 RepID=UPI0034CE089E
MSDQASNSVDAVYIPLGYVTPDFPSLKWPTGRRLDSQYYLYYRYDIWKFTLFWTLILYAVAHGVAALWAVLMNRRVKSAVVFSIYLGVGLIEALISGSIIGAILGLIYTAGLFTMSTWIPFVWGVVQLFVVIMTGYSMASTVI